MPTPAAYKKDWKNQLWDEVLGTLLPGLPREAATEWGATPRQWRDAQSPAITPPAATNAPYRRTVLSGDSGVLPAVERQPLNSTQTVPLMQHSGTTPQASATAGPLISKDEGWLAKHIREANDKAQAARPKHHPAPGEMLGQCEYYTQRADAFTARTGKKAPPYYRDYGYKYCNKFKDLEKQLSPEGQEWAEKARLYLQQAMEKELKNNPALEYDAEAFEDMAFGTHLAAYWSAGFYDMPFRDKMDVFSTIQLKDWLKNDAALQGFLMGTSMLLEWSNRRSDTLTDTLKKRTEIEAELITKFWGNE